MGQGVFGSVLAPLFGGTALTLRLLLSVRGTSQGSTPGPWRRVGVCVRLRGPDADRERNLPDWCRGLNGAASDRIEPHRLGQKLAGEAMQR